jgi:hypothetical protein
MKINLSIKLKDYAKIKNKYDRIIIQQFNCEIKRRTAEKIK